MIIPLSSTSHWDSILMRIMCSVFKAILSLLRRITILWSNFNKTARYIYRYIVGIQEFNRAKDEDLGDLTMFMELLNKQCRRHSNAGILRMNLLFKPVVVLFKPEMVEVVLTSHSMIDKAEEYKLLHSFMGTGLVTSSGCKWKQRRKLLTPAFHFKKLEDFVPVFQEKSRALLKRIEEVLDEPWTDVVDMILPCSLEIICQTAMDARVNSLHGEAVEYRKAVHQVATTFMYRLMRPWLKYDFLFNCTRHGRKYNRYVKIFKNFTRKMIQEKKAQMLEAHAGTPEDPADSLTKKKMFLELLLEVHLRDPLFTEEDIMEEVDTFVAAGFETTGLTMSWLLYLIGLNEDVQREIHDEMDAIFGDDVTRDVGRDDITQMKYLECVIKETLRLYPTVPFIARTVYENSKILNHKVSKGTFCAVYPYMLHRDEKYFPDPEKFDPERFFPENCAGRHPYAYIPFSAGPRNCIGQKFGMMEMKVVLSDIFRNYKVTSLDPRHKVKIVPTISLRNAQPVRVRFERRRT